MKPMETAYCGLQCQECPVYLASLSGNTTEQIRLATEYSTDTCHFEPEDMYCLGCHSDAPSQKMCSDCDIRNRGLEQSHGGPLCR